MFQGLDDGDKFDSVTGLAPAIAVRQSIIRQSNPRSTVGSRTGIIGMLGMLYAGDGQILCSSCGRPLDGRCACAKCRTTEERLQGSAFLYNSPNGMCVRYGGRGAYFEINMRRLVPGDRTTLRQVFATAGVTPGYMKVLARQFKDLMEKPFWACPRKRGKRPSMDTAPTEDEASA